MADAGRRRTDWRRIGSWPSGSCLSDAGRQLALYGAVAFRVSLVSQFGSLTRRAVYVDCYNLDTAAHWAVGPNSVKSKKYETLK